MDGCIGLDDFYFVSGDSGKIEFLQKAYDKLGGVDVLFHLAAINGTRWFHERPDLVVRVNHDTTQAAIEFAGRYGCRIVYTSSPEAFGEQSEMPLREDSNSLFTPAHLHRRHSYGASKYISELLIQHAVHNDALDARIVRPFNAYGPRLPGGAYGQVVSIFLTACLHGRDIKLHGGGEQTRSFTYVDDIVEAIRLTGELDAGIDGSRMAGSTYNIGSAEEISIADLATACIAVSGAEISIVSAKGHPGDALRRIPDQSTAIAALGWQPIVPLEQGLERCWSWIKSSLAEASD